MAAAAQPAGAVRLHSGQGRRVLAATVFGTGMAFLDGTVVNVALPRIGDDLDAGFSSLQWLVNAYGLTLAGLLVLGGSLGDRYGRRRVFAVGAVWFALASALCAAAPTIELLVAARALQGVGAALLTPGSLAIIEATFHEDDRGAAIGTWSGLAGVAAAIGPFVGGWLVGAASWRLIFVLNLPLAAAVVALARTSVPETSDAGARSRPLDVPGAVLLALGLTGIVYALTAGAAHGFSRPLVVASAAVGVAACGALLAVERRSRNPLLPLELLVERGFAAANLVTTFVYAALSAMLFLLPTALQVLAGQSPLESGAALVPLTAVMLLLSRRAGQLAQRIGPRLPLTVGPLLAAAGMALLARVGMGASYVGDVLPAVLVWALGMSLLVAPLTSAALAAAGERRAGIAAALNNEAARVAGLVGVAIVPALGGIAGTAYREPATFQHGFRVGVLACAALCALGGVVAFVALRGATSASRARPVSHCAVAGPPLRPCEHAEAEAG